MVVVYKEVKTLIPFANSLFTSTAAVTRGFIGLSEPSLPVCPDLGRVHSVNPLSPVEAGTDIVLAVGIVPQELIKDVGVASVVTKIECFRVLESTPIIWGTWFPVVEVC